MADTVLASAVEAGTLDKIADGELVLPSPVDALHYHNRINNISTPTATESKQQLTINQLMERLRVLEEKQSPTQSQPTES